MNIMNILEDGGFTRCSGFVSEDCGRGQVGDDNGDG